MKLNIAILLLFTLSVAHGQWQILDSHSNADLYSVDNYGNGVAWAAGANGSILITQDAGRNWHQCAVPPGSANLDFRGIQAFSEIAAVVMSSGKGQLSRLYKTIDGCRTWTKVFDNPHASGSFVALRRSSAFQIYLLGEPVNGRFQIFSSANGGATWEPFEDSGLETPKGASNVSASASFANVGSQIAFGIRGQRADVYALAPVCGNAGRCTLAWTGKPTPLAQTSAESGVSALAGRTTMVRSTAPVTGIATMPATTFIAVGGDPGKPAQRSGTAAFSEDGGVTWKAAANPPSGFRTSVAFDPEHDRFIAVGPTGTDVSNDDGNDWFALKPSATDDPKADQGWVAISLPFVVGLHGRIGVLRSDEASALLTTEDKHNR